jgi:CheY-like chemotaxis protein
LARKILLADDSVTAQNMGRKILADAGYDVVTVNNGSAALKKITEIKPDLIVLDVYMPGYSGLEVCQRVKDADETAHIPVLLTVGKLEPFKPEEARRVRADAHIVKPFEASELLTAITRLEDRMVPQQSEGMRFGTPVSGLERFGGEGSGWKAASNAEGDTGWRSRLRFPVKKKQEEPEAEAEDAAAGAAFRDFRKGKGKTAASAVFTVKAPLPPGQEPGLVPDIPRDITPDELDALSALVAKLDGPIPAAENVAPLAEKMGPVETPGAEVAAAMTEVEVASAAAEANKEEKTEVETPAPVVEAAAAAVEAPALAVEEKSEAEIPAGRGEPAVEAAAAVAGPAAVETYLHETEHPETPAAVAAVAVDVALLAQEPAPVDRNDEPMFASAAIAVEQAAGVEAGEKIEGERTEAVAKSEASAPAEAATAKGLESQPEVSQPEESKAEPLHAEELQAEEIAQSVPVAASGQEAAEAEDPAPSDEELAEALRLLTPAAGHADFSPVPPPGTLVEAGQLRAEEAARNAATGPRWVAEPVTLSPEEAAISLEAEMFRTFATMPVAMSAAASGGEIEPVRATGVSAIAAAVENRLTEAEMAASAKALAEQEAESCLPERCSSELAPETTAAEAAVMEAPAEEAAAATFADGVGKNEAAAPAEQNGEFVSGTTAAVAEDNQDSSSDAGGQESMGESVKAKSGKSNWHQIHTAAASTAANSDVVEAAKQAESRAEEAPKARAAAAAEGSASTPATDASTIASIVDSVLADLRPRIVEEIARKLAGK